MKISAPQVVVPSSPEHTQPGRAPRACSLPVWPAGTAPPSWPTWGFGASSGRRFVWAFSSGTPRNYMGAFPKWGYPKNRCKKWKIPWKYDWKWLNIWYRVPPFQETSMWVFLWHSYGQNDRTSGPSISPGQATVLPVSSWWLLPQAIGIQFLTTDETWWNSWESQGGSLGKLMTTYATSVTNIK